MLTAVDLAVLRGERLVLRNIGFTVSPGTALLLRGANGAGKSTLLRAIAGLTPIASGHLLWDDEDALEDLPTHARRIAWLGHQDAVKLALTVYENVPSPMALAAVGLGAYAHLPARLLSAGQKRRLAIARVIASPAPLWLLDEPTTGLDDASVAQFQATCEAFLAKDGMIIASTHLPFAITGVETLHL